MHLPLTHSRQALSPLAAGQLLMLAPEHSGGLVTGGLVLGGAVTGGLVLGGAVTGELVFGGVVVGGVVSLGDTGGRVGAFRM